MLWKLSTQKKRGKKKGLTVHLKQSMRSHTSMRGAIKKKKYLGHYLCLSEPEADVIISKAWTRAVWSSLLQYSSATAGVLRQLLWHYADMAISLCSSFLFRKQEPLKCPWGLKPRRCKCCGTWSKQWNKHRLFLRSLNFFPRVGFCCLCAFFPQGDSHAALLLLLGFI